MAHSLSGLHNHEVVTLLRTPTGVDKELARIGFASNLVNTSLCCFGIPSGVALMITMLLLLHLNFFWGRYRAFGAVSLNTGAIRGEVMDANTGQELTDTR